MRDSFYAIQRWALTVPVIPQEIYQRYLWAGPPLTQNADAVAEMFAVDGVFVVETDTAFDRSEGIEIVSMVKIFRMRAGEIILLRDYFSPDLVD